MRTASLATALLALLTGACQLTSISGSTNGSAPTGGPPPLLIAGAPCASNPQCASGICGIDGTGNCCADRCPPSTDSCGVTSCDDTGACAFPDAGTPCGQDSCSGNELTRNTCDGSGSCTPGAPLPCPDHRSCNTAGTGCRSACASSDDCANGLLCNGGSCLQPVQVGPCTENDDCTSGICGVGGTGHCCLTSCPATTPPCGATDCDPLSGICEDADAGTPCGSTIASCVEGVQQTPSSCNGLGDCPTLPAVNCAPYLCGSTTCLASCSDDGSCAAGDYCDLSEATCCPQLVSGGAIAVDSINGSDALGCCGAGGNPPCRTIAHAMRFIDLAQVPFVTLNLSVGGAGGSWAPPGEGYPIVLGWGVELNAPGIFFGDPEGNPEIFDIATFSASDFTTLASIVGTQTNPVQIGVDPSGTQSPDPSSIQVEFDHTLYIASAAVSSSAINRTTAITVAGGATLALGADRSSSVFGTVTIGNDLDSLSSDGWIGIECATDGTGDGCTITDAEAGGNGLLHSVVIQGQAGWDIDAHDGADVELNWSPIIGVAPLAIGFSNCLSKVDATQTAAVNLVGTASASFTNATVQCLAGTGFQLTSSDSGAPLLLLLYSTIQNTQQAIYAGAGTARIANSTIRYNYNGVEQDSSGIIDLSGGVYRGTNSVVCSNSIEDAFAQFGSAAISVLNTTSSLLDASDVAWDTAGPDLFSCPQGPPSPLCTYQCQIASCTNSSGQGSLDAVEAFAGTILTTGNTLSTIDCSPPGSP